MPRRKQESNRSATAKVDAAGSWISLTWDDVERWAGSRSLARGETYQRQGCVDNLVLADDGRLLATVTGTRRYVTSAWLESGKQRKRAIASKCTCPVGASGCKHAVAVVLALLELLADDEQVAVADPSDRRWSKLAGADDEAFGEIESDDFDEDSPEEDDDAQNAVDRARKTSAAKRGTGRKERQSGKRLSRAKWNEKIKAHLQTKSREELSDMAWSLVERFPELRQEFQERIALGEGDVGQLLAQARREIRTVTAEMGWRNGWTGEGHMPDYSRLKHRLERLAELGYCDEVIGLGRDLIQRGMEQVGQSDDEGETASQLADCLDVVFHALGKSKLSSPDRILYVIDAFLEDDYDLIGESAGEILDAKYSQADWSAVADRLAERLKRLPADKNKDKFSSRYQRDHLSNFLLDALKRAGREEELLSIYEREARATGSYERLVSYLIEKGQYEQAEQLAREGIEKTSQQLPGIASNLARLLCEVARRRKQWDIVAAHVANNFFENPGPKHFNELLEAAERAKCREQVQTAALQFLETGVLPIQGTSNQKSTKKAVSDPSWPLPVPDYLLPLLRRSRMQGAPRPHFEVLLEMAIAAKQPNDVLRWYDKIVGDEKSSKRGEYRWMAPHVDANRIAKAVAATHPERALEIIRRKLNSYLQQTGHSAYQECADCLRQMRSIYKSLDQKDHWVELVADIRFKYRNRPRFMETLDRMENRKIVKSQKATRR